MLSRRTGLSWRPAILALVAALLASAGAGVDLAQAAVPSPDLSISIDANGDTVPDCTTQQSPPAGSCSLTQGQQFTVRARLTSLAGLPNPDGDAATGYFGVQVRLLNSAGLVRNDRAAMNEWGPAASPFWPACSFRAESIASSTDYLGGCTVGSTTESMYMGLLMEVDYTCTGSSSTQRVTLVHGAPLDSHVLGETVAPAIDQNDNAVAEVLTVYCGAFLWDVDGDGVVSVSDIGFVVVRFGGSSPEADFDGDGIVSIGDIGQVVAHFGEQAPV
ncbi:MAG: hypothetical protein WEE64_01385 [Dehalococcoidia bacterium]